MFDFLNFLQNGYVLAMIGAALAIALPCIGSAKGVGTVAEAASGLLAEDPSKFGKVFLLVALPSSQAIYGFVTALLIFYNISPDMITMENGVYEGAYYLMAALPIALAGYFSAVRQGRVAAAGVNLVAKRADQSGKAILNAAMVETFAIFALLISLLMVVMK